MNVITALYNKFYKYNYLTNIFMVVVKIILFFLTNNYAFIIYSFYSLCIGLTKKNIFFNDKGKYNIVGILLAISSILFVNYSYFVIKVHYNTDYDLYRGITIATVIFADIIFAIVGIVKANKNRNLQNKILKLTNLATSLISLQLVPTALLSFTQVGIDNSLFNGIGGIIFGICSLIISFYIIKIVNTNSKKY